MRIMCPGSFQDSNEGTHIFRAKSLVTIGICPVCFREEWITGGKIAEHWNKSEPQQAATLAPAPSQGDEQAIQGGSMYRISGHVGGGDKIEVIPDKVRVIFDVFPRLKRLHMQDDEGTTCIYNRGERIPAIERCLDDQLLYQMNTKAIEDAARMANIVNADNPEDTINYLGDLMTALCFEMAEFDPEGGDASGFAAWLLEYVDNLVNGPNGYISKKQPDPTREQHVFSQEQWKARNAGPHHADIEQLRLSAEKVPLDRKRERLVLETVADLLQIHDDTGISLDDWPSARGLCEDVIGHDIKENNV